MSIEYKKGDLVKALLDVETLLPSLLADPDIWQSKYINYHPPYVERLWMEMGEYRINLHRIHSCGEGEALFHPHPWASAMRVLEGRYEMDVGYSESDDKPPVATTITFENGGSVYEMIDPNGWHSVRPLDDVCYSLMVTGKPNDRRAPGSGKSFRELRKDERMELISVFKKLYKDT